ncbi:hypothetical protein QAD02_011883 [Eretmocerus hayati]|uniref:Uncharacterized protein n=1 Tax=Eretmocerus hayati TaxID=131215 RepID=A0ACC2NY99_9HYME|nr:hypothetical protein QAD02_011883 [Eretmocerus hayati]
MPQSINTVSTDGVMKDVNDDSLMGALPRMPQSINTVNNDGEMRDCDNELLTGALPWMPQSMVSNDSEITEDFAMRLLPEMPQSISTIKNNDVEKNMGVHGKNTDSGTNDNISGWKIVYVMSHSILFFTNDYLFMGKEPVIHFMSADCNFSSLISQEFLSYNLLKPDDLKALRPAIGQVLPFKRSDNDRDILIS